MMNYNRQEFKYIMENKAITQTPQLVDQQADADINTAQTTADKRVIKWS